MRSRSLMGLGALSAAAAQSCAIGTVGIEGIELNTSNWSTAPHCDLAALIDSAVARSDLLDAIAHGDTESVLEFVSPAVDWHYTSALEQGGFTANGAGMLAQALRQVKGVGDQKLADLGPRFLEAITAYGQANGATPATASDRQGDGYV